MLRIEIFSDRKESLGEGPLWDVKEERLYWIDSYGPTVHRADLKGGDRRSWTMPEPIGSLALREKGGAVLALRSGFHFLDFDSGKVTRINETQPGELRPRLNDGKVDRQGRFVAGSMDYCESDPVGKLFRLDPDLKVSELDSGIICSNGPCFSPDGKTLYFTDSFTKIIFAYDYDTATGDVRSKRAFGSFAELQGYPDGATVDSEGYVWSVEVYAGRLVRFNPDGVIDRVVGLPVFSSTSISFGGPNLDIAFVTSMARPFKGRYHREHEAGMTVAVHGLGVRGIAEPRFKG
ncbi:SMP-30/gluconolactonase/LRE family protein [Dongia rigui]|uniref:SMP-30/gluconolactonase/LRE family protein n=1 Tax=Dongia rigui TaxID=940149 RepID=A0ABU5E2J6_9PROT|nr:SMP-30/gluconolactonase/LRE family protein [Dongia rigui]MDY0873827.1 SMP-30/gluconolactonase/LRE family protein [Dongia rigui]